MSVAPLLAVLLVPLGHAGPYAGPAAHAPRTEARQVATFDAVSAAGPFDVAITLGDAPAVSVTCDADLVDRIETVVRGKELHLEVADHRRFEPRGDCRIDVTATQVDAVALAGSGDVAVHGTATGLSSLVLAGSGNLDVDSAQGAELSVDLAGSGNITIAGSVQALDVRVAGSGDIDLGAVHAARARVRISGSGDVTVAAEERVDAQIAGSGDVVVHGSPEVHQSVIGSGRVRVL